VRARAQRQHHRPDREIRTLEVDDEAAEGDPTTTPNAQKPTQKMADLTVNREAHGAVADGDAADAAVVMGSSNIAVIIRSPEHERQVPQMGKTGHHRAPALIGQAPPVIARPEMP
jgi:hypothetical protein